MVVFNSPADAPTILVQGGHDVHHESYLISGKAKCKNMTLLK
jgi:hypothetical protein